MSNQPAPSVGAPSTDDIRHALEHGDTIDITTTGRRFGLPHRIELVFHAFAGRLYISGRPGRRDWYANLVANPAFTVPPEARSERGPAGRRQAHHRRSRAP